MDLQPLSCLILFYSRPMLPAAFPAARRLVHPIAVRFFRYKILREIGGGTFGTVYEGLYRGQRYALKKYTYANEPIHHTSVREIKALRRFNSPYILPILEIALYNYQVYLVFPYYPDDLSSLLVREPLTLLDCRDILFQALSGLKELHSAGIVHRDLKPANLLIKPKSKGDSKYSTCICDFGMARTCAVNMTPGAVTLWYRAPELLLGWCGYGTAVDIWSVGCVMYEMIKGVPLFKGNNEIEQLEMISGVCGSINKENIPNCERYPNYSKYKLFSGENRFREILRGVPDDAADLIEKMLVLDPGKRYSVDECLHHPFLDCNVLKP